MATITEDYVSLETAKLLKEKGFGIKTTAVYTITDCLFKNYNMRGGIVVKKGQFFNMQFGGYKANGTAVPAPTLQMAMKWLREVHDKIIEICADISNDFKSIVYRPAVYDKKDLGCLWESDGYKSYEEAVKEALKYSLENLI